MVCFRRHRGCTSMVQSSGQDIDPLTWGGPATAIEVYCCLDQGADWHRRHYVWNFGTGQAQVNLRKDLYLNQGLNGSKGIFQVRRHDTEGFKQLECPTPWQPGKWTHVVCVVRGNSLNIYKDGALLGQKFDGQDPQISRRENMWLGKGPEGEFFHGTIAYFRIYDKQLPTQIIQNLYEKRDVLTPHWKTSEICEDAPVNDKVGCCTIL